MMLKAAVSVVDLACFCHRSGDIDHRFSPSPTGIEGIEGHQRLYKRRPDSYLREHPLEISCVAADVELHVRGRADGYDPREGYVEEIKTCRVRSDSIPASVSKGHLTQGRIYAALIARNADLDGLEVRLTWFNIDSGREDTLSQQYTRRELDDFLDASLEYYAAWLKLISARRKQRDSSLEVLEFPLGDFRPGQREIAELVYKCIDQAGQLMIEAPTGLGKTAAVLYPALKALATGKHERLLFVTARTVGSRTAEHTLADFSAAGMYCPAITLTAKEQICFEPGRACHPDECPFARGYYDRLGAAMDQAIDAGCLNRAAIERIARDNRVCPYQLSLDLLPWIDVVICDQHYLYSPGGLLPPLIEQSGQRWTALVDEAHNLPGRARRMYSASLSKARVMAVKRGAPRDLEKSLAGINRCLLALQKQAWSENDFHSELAIPESLLVKVEEFVVLVSRRLQREPLLLVSRSDLREFFHDCLQFLRVAEHWGEDFRFEMRRTGGSQSLQLALNCLDPARLLCQRNEDLHSLTVFSATLSPLQWVGDALGLSTDAVYQRQGSPFDSRQLQVQIVTTIDTRYRERELSLPALAERILDWLKGNPGNCILYFPSYAYMQDCLAQLHKQGLGRYAGHLWVQERDSDRGAREELLSLLDTQRHVSAFCILGGVFGEGIDLPGNRLSSVVVVGVGMPQHNRDTQQLRDYFQQRYGSGFEYAYLYPGMQKVDQALGRVIRSPRDQGSALLIDSRYALSEYRQLLPPWWEYSPDIGWKST